jgi:thiamine biosynthesis lipoprotein
LTGYPVEGIYSVTVLIEPSQRAGTLSDVLSKPLFISRKENRKDMAKKLGIYHYLIIEEKYISMTKTMADKIQFLNPLTQKNNQIEITL